MSTRSRVNEGLQRERGVRRSLQRGVTWSLQEEKAGYFLTTEVLGERDYYQVLQYWRIRLMPEQNMYDTLSEGKHSNIKSHLTPEVDSILQRSM